MNVNEVSVTDTESNHGTGIASGIPKINPLPQISARTSIGPSPIGRVVSASQSGQNTPIGGGSGHQTPVNYTPRGTTQLSEIVDHFPPVANSDDDNNSGQSGQRHTSQNTDGGETKDLKKPAKQDGINIEEFTKNMTARSRDIIMKMDKDGDGTISYEEAASFGKHAKKVEQKWKHLFAGAVCFIFVIFGVIFGLFILGFELTKVTDIGGNTGNALITTSGTQITTVTGEEGVTIENFWDDDITIDDMILRYIHGYFSNEYFYIMVSYFIKHDTPDYLEIFDNSGNIRIDYYLDVNESPNGDQVVLYQTLSNGTIIERISDAHESATLTARRLQGGEYGGGYCCSYGGGGGEFYGGYGWKSGY